MEDHSFSLVSIEIRDTFEYINKNLKNGIYSFEHFKNSKEQEAYDGFFGKNISVHALVGKNGAGKSSLLEVMYRVINNLAYALFGNGSNSEELSFISNVNARINFRINGTDYWIDNKLDKLSVYVRGKEEVLFDKNKRKDFLETKTSLDSIKNIANNLFYSIVTNYSIQSLISSEYELAEQYCSQIRINQDYELVNWMDNMFHKNDGYQTPIVLNPFRDNGTIDGANENYLSRNRLVAILFFFKANNISLLDGYSFHSVNYYYDEWHLLRNFLNADDQDNIAEKEKIIDKFKSCLFDKDYIAHSIISSYGFDVERAKKSRVLTIAYFYLVYKTITIAGRYSTYSDYEDYGKKELCFEKLGVTKGYWEFAEIGDFVSQIQHDKSHIALKINQTVNFINSFSDDQIMMQPINTTIGVDDYSQFNIYEIMTTLFPPFYNCRILFTKGSKTVEYARMSSGERQILATISSHLYHIQNILSIGENESRIAYRYFNLIFDETELCFHPDYQVIFIDRLIEAIKGLKLNEKAGFNIILTTHSPFLLSDIPRNFILYLKDGMDQSKNINLNPFCANVNAILRDSFLMDHGFTGMFAQKKVRDLIQFLEEKDYQESWNVDKAELVINSIGDPLLKDTMSRILSKYLYKHDVTIYDKRIKKLSLELERLKSLKNNEKNTD